MNIILITALFAAAVAFILGTTLGFFKQLFFVKEDPTMAAIRDVLPGANCGACGYPGCEQYAGAVAAGKAPSNACTVGGQATAAKIAEITGGEAGEVVEQVAVIACQGSSIHTPPKCEYTGLKTCRGAKIAGGTKLCSWGCQGFGDCVKACSFGAITMTENNLPKIDYSKCGGCGACVKECPMSIINLIPRKQKGAIVLCSNKNPVKQQIAKTCKISCFKCGACVRNCPKQCITLDGLNPPIVDYTKDAPSGRAREEGFNGGYSAANACDSCGTCAEKCPSKVFKIIERDLLIS